MNRKFFGLMALALLVAPLAAQAQTLEFYAGISGTSTTLLRWTLGPPDTLPLVSHSFVGSITASIALNGSASATYTVALNEHGDGGPGPGIQAENAFSLTGEFGGAGSGYYMGSEGYIQIVTDINGAITGAIVNVNNSDTSYNSFSTAFMIGPTGVDASLFGILSGEDGAGCQAAELTFSPRYPNGIYTGPNIKNCTVAVDSAKPGHWTVDGATADQ